MSRGARGALILKGQFGSRKHLVLVCAGRWLTVTMTVSETIPAIELDDGDT